MYSRRHFGATSSDLALELYCKMAPWGRKWGGYKQYQGDSEGVQDTRLQHRMGLVEVSKVCGGIGAGAQLRPWLSKSLRGKYFLPPLEQH